MVFGFTGAFMGGLLAAFTAGEAAPRGSAGRLRSRGGRLVAGRPWSSHSGAAPGSPRGQRPSQIFLDLTAERIRIDRPHRWRRAREEPIEVRTSDVGNVKLNAGVLTIDVGAQRIPLTTAFPVPSESLTGPEKEWLYGVLTRWRNVEPGAKPEPKAE